MGARIGWALAVGAGLFALAAPRVVEAQICERVGYTRHVSCAAEARDATGCCPPAPPPRVARSRAQGLRCPEGQQRMDTGCCWPGQRFRAGACTGRIRSCPEGLASHEREGHPGQSHCAPPGVRGGPMVAVPAGRTADASAEVAAPFFIDRTPVTVGDYAACVAAGACRAPEGDYCNYDGSASLHPVDCVPYADAASYCAHVGKRLPTGAEWELAARGTEDERPFPWGHQAPHDDNAHWGQVCGRPPCTAPVGSYPGAASPYGVLDMAGNVWEWTSDRATGSFQMSRPGSFGVGRYAARGVRGGGWASVARELHAAREDWHPEDCGRGCTVGGRPTLQVQHIGIRCAADGVASTSVEVEVEVRKAGERASRDRIRARSTEARSGTTRRRAVCAGGLGRTVLNAECSRRIPALPSSSRRHLLRSSRRRRRPS